MNMFLKSAEEGNAQAQYRLGLAYALGHGVKKDYEESVKWLVKSSAQGNIKAQYHLGYCYSTGKGVCKNSQAAYGWLFLAKAGGDEAATLFLMAIEKILSPGQLESARSWAREWKPVCNIPV